MQPPASAPGASPWRMSVAPMMDWTDRHCRYLHRLLTRHTLLYTETAKVGGILSGGTERPLRDNAEELKQAHTLVNGRHAKARSKPSMTNTWP